MEDYFDLMVARIPGFCGKREDYQVSIAEQAAYLAALRPLDKYSVIAMSMGRKYKIKQPRLSALADYLSCQDTEKPKTEDHLKQLAVKWCRSQTS